MIRKDTFDSKGEQNRMLSNFIIALEAVLPIFMIMGIGMLIRRKGLVDAHDVKKMNQTVFTVFFPVLMFSNLYGKDIRGAIDDLWRAGSAVCLRADGGCRDEAPQGPQDAQRDDSGNFSE